MTIKQQKQQVEQRQTKAILQTLQLQLQLLLLVHNSYIISYLIRILTSVNLQERDTERER